MGVIFNIPRAILLTSIGVVVGVLFFTLGDVTGFKENSVWVGAVGYTIVGSILSGYGLYNLAKAIDDMESLKDGAASNVKMTASSRIKGELPHGRFARWVAERTCGARRGAFLGVWGGVLGLGCVGETVLAVELVLLGGGVGVLASSAAEAAVAGGLVMFFFSLGLSIPLILLTAGSGAMGEKALDQKRMTKFRLASSVVMMLIGLVILYITLPKLFL